MRHSSATYTFRIRPARAGWNRVRSHLKMPQVSLQSRPGFRSNSTGKERDEETGYGYFGARYMDHELMTMWLSVDPMADKYPSLSPYNYCAWNPVKLIDPDGKEIWKPEITSKGKVSYVAEAGDSKETFVRQYNVSRKAADAIFKNAGITKVKKGTRISGDIVASSVTNKTGRKYNDVLKINWNASKDQKVYHVMFAILCNKVKSGECVTNFNQFINGLRPDTGADACFSVKRPVEIPLTDGKTMYLQFFDATFSRRFPQVISQPLSQFDNSDGESRSYNQQFHQYPAHGSGIPRLLIAFPEKYQDSYYKDYYNQ